MGLGIILSAMSEAGKSFEQSIDQQQKASIESDLIQKRNEAERVKQEAIVRLQNQLINAPMDRFQKITQEQSQIQAPQTGAPVTEINNAGVKASGVANQDDSDQHGLQGSVSSLSTLAKKFQDVLTNPNATPEQIANANGILSQLKQELVGQKKANADAVAGQTRDRTPEETLAASLAYAKIHDPAAYKSALDAGLVPSPMKIGANESLVDNKGAVIYQNTAGQDKEIKIAQMKIDADKDRNKEDNDTKLKVAQLQDKDPQFIKELKNLYPEGSQEYTDALMARIGKESGANGGAGGRANVFNSRVIGAGNQALHSIQNIVDLPMGSTSGWLGGYQPGHSLLGSTLAVLKNNLNNQDVQTYNVIKLGLSRALATMESSGLAPPGSLVNSMDKMDFSTGDTGMTTLRKIAEAKQIATAALEQKMNDPSVQGESRKFVEKLIDGFNKAVPYNHADLTALEKASKTNPDITFADLANQKLKGTSTDQTAESTLPKGWSVEVK